ncbi:MAG: biotin--[acetyl-CoA-carboxylase] ligase [Propionibacteriaceae bacterium]|nr:biotin--[acetyl-CoA-carboxylase] ligase [Propionibacteriaceae bacterium]
MFRVKAELPDALRIRSRLEPGATFRRVDVVETTGSTNADLSARAREGESEGAALVAMEQTAGRGRLDRQWVSPRGASISLSMLLKPKPEFLHWGWLSLLAGMAVSSALAELAPNPQRVTLKWPNDVLIGGKKVCGILSERIEQPDGARAVVGLGINVTLREDELPVPTATSLALEGITTDQSRIVAGVLNHFSRYYTAWQLRGSLREEYEARCSSMGAQLSVVVDDAHTVEGTGRGVDHFGRLQVATAAGLQTFAVGDVIHARLG